MLHPSGKAQADEENPTGRRLRLIRASLSADDAGTGEGCFLADANGTERPSAADFARTVIDRARAGEPEAFQAIFNRYSKPVGAFLYHLTGDRSRTEELAQETFFRAFRGLNRMNEGIRLSTWIFGIARNVAHEALRDLRRNRRQVGLEDGPHLTLQDGRSNPADSLVGGELREVIRHSMMALSEDQRVVFVLKLLHKMRYQEISAITGYSIGKLKTDLHRARQVMRERLRPYVAGKDVGM